MKLVSIHKGNYEAYLLDRMEGRLPEDLSRELDAFLAQNPQLAEDLEGMGGLSFAAEPVAFNASALKKSEYELVDEQSFVAYIENQLNAEDRLFVEKSAANNPVLEQELLLFKKTILEPDADIIYAPKSKLKRKPKVIWLNTQFVRYAAAAVLLLFMGLAFTWYRQQPRATLANDSHHSEQKTMQAAPNAPRQNMPQQQPMLSNNAVAPANQAFNPNVVKASKQASPESPRANTPKVVAPQQETLIANNKPAEKDTAQPQPVVMANSTKTNESPSVASTHKMITIIESDDEDADASSKKKKGLWALAGKALKGLNKAGLKTVDGKEKDSPKTTDYLLTLGGIQVSHSQGLQ